MLSIALTAGDPGGIGPEVLVKTLTRAPLSPKFRYVVYGSEATFQLLKSKLGLVLPPKVQFFDITDNVRVKGNLKPSIGRVSRINAAIAYASLGVATRHVARGDASALVTAPINKTAMRLIDPRFHGHTEFLAAAAKTKKYAMMFVGSKLKVTLVTIHVPLKKVSGLITRQNVAEKIQLTHDFLKKYFRISKPRIAVCALNPHGRETGTEDESVIRPAVNSTLERGVDVVGPLSADQLFHDASEGRFDAVIAMYHDQGLAPFKMISFRDGVNVTLGLPFLRTSPDHGTAFDIAYQGKADWTSFQSSLRLAEKLCLRKSN